MSANGKTKQTHNDISVSLGTWKFAYTTVSIFNLSKCYASNTIVKANENIITLNKNNIIIRLGRAVIFLSMKSTIDFAQSSVLIAVKLRVKNA